ncbi:MAG: AEC family transporter [Pigmentiphaga sp.]|nr:AEC family transporter [Pigmentiphaga sp.]
MIALGWLLKQRGGFSPLFFQGLERLIYFVLFPALLFLNIARTPLEPATATGLLWTAALLIGGGMLLAMLAGPLLKVGALQLASAQQCGFRFNSYIGLALASRIAGESGQTTMALLIGFAVPMANLAAVLPLARQAKLNLFKELLSNPMVVATLGGLAFNLAGLTLPAPVEMFLGRLSAAAIALGLMCVGTGLMFTSLKAHWPLVSYQMAVKLLILPLATWLVLPYTPFDAETQRTILLFAALPTASSAYVLTTRMGGDGPLVAGLISLSTLVSLATLPLWISFL